MEVWTAKRYGDVLKLLKDFPEDLKVTSSAERQWECTTLTYTGIAHWL